MGASGSRVERGEAAQRDLELKQQSAAAAEARLAEAKAAAASTTARRVATARRGRSRRSSRRRAARGEHADERQAEHARDAADGTSPRWRRRVSRRAVVGQLVKSSAG